MDTPTLVAPREPELPLSAGQRLRRLSRRELCVLIRVRDGWRNRQIADDLGITESTVKSHVSALLRKLDVQTRTQAAVMAQCLLGGQPRRAAASTDPAPPLAGALAATG